MQRSGRLKSFSESIGVPIQAVTASNRGKSSPSRSNGFHEALTGVGFEELVFESTMSGIPSVAIGEIGIGEERAGDREVSVLGSGLTAQVVLHVTDDTTKMVLPPKTTVALKIFRPRSADDHLSWEITRQSVYDTILREMRAFGHRSLSGHPNIVQLLFIGWRMDDPFPILGMELGQLGSLDYVIKAPSTGLSTLHKRHLTLDIALGLYAIHQAGFAHGDLKPDNIILFRHAEDDRRVVAKLSDFGGSFQAFKEASGKPVHATPLWCSPEVLNRDPDVDWERADVYSYGLVVGSIWGSDSGGYESQSLEGSSACFLSRLMPRILGEKDVTEYLWYIKSQNAPITTLAQRLAEVETDAMDQAQLLELLTPVLQAHFWLRPDTEGLVRSLAPLAASIPRSILGKKDATVDGSDGSRASAERLRSLILNWAKSTNLLEIMQQQNTLRIKEVGKWIDFVPTTDDIPSHFPEELSASEFLKCLHNAFMRLLPEEIKVFGAEVKDSDVPNEIATKSRLSYAMALLNSIKPNAHLHREKEIELMRDAALHGSEPAICQATLMLEGTHLESQFPVRFYLSLLALSHSNRAMQILSTRWPSLWKLLRSVILERPSAYEKAGKEIDMKGVSFLRSRFNLYLTEPHPPERKLTLRESIAFGAVEQVEKVLHGTVLASDWDEVLPGLLHELSSLSDAQAASLARAAYEEGAKLDHFGSVESPLMKGYMKQAFSHLPSLLSPLSTAIKRGKPLLAAAIFCIHVEFDVPVPDFSEALKLSFQLLYHNIGEMLLQLYYQNPAMCKDNPKARGAMETPLSELLSITQFDTYKMELQRRAMHGGEYDKAYLKTLQVLLAQGVDPTAGLGLSCPLAHAISTDDINCVKLYIQHIQDRGSDVVAHLEDPENVWQEGENHLPYTALSLCVQFCSIRCLEYFVTDFPRFPTVTQLPLIHEACSLHSDIRLISLLLKGGADVMYKTSSGLTTLHLALSQVNLPAADVIATHCSEEQLEMLLRRDPDTGRSLFSDLLLGRKAYTIRRQTPRTRKLVDSLRWLADHGGAHFHPSCFEEILGHTRPLSRNDQMLDLGLFEFMLDQFSDQVATEAERMKMLYKASVYGHVEIVKLLVGRNFDVDGDVDDIMGLARFAAKERCSTEGTTILEVLYLSAARAGVTLSPTRYTLPDQRGWEEDIEEIKRVLVANSKHSNDYHVHKARTIVAGVEELTKKLPGNREEILNGIWADAARRRQWTDEESAKYRRAMLDESERRQESSSTWPESILRPINSSSEGLKRREPHPTNLSAVDLWAKIVDYPKERHKWLQELKAKQRETDPRFLEEMRRAARLAKQTWRLPPTWILIDPGRNKKDQGPRRTSFLNCRTGLVTSQKPALYLGRKVAPLGGADGPQGVTGSSPTAPPKRPRNKGKEPVRPDQDLTRAIQTICFPESN